ncbi:MAG: ferrochelatase, partial [Myxococcota bacterium]
MSDFDAILLVSFGGPENDEEVMPFLEHVVEGRGVPRERLLSVAEHYYKLGGSPINGQNRDLIGALRDELEEHAEGRPIYFGNRHSAPFLKDTLAQMAKDGVKSAAAILTSAFSSYSGCRQYREAVLAAQEAISDAPKVRYVRRFFNHPGFIDAMVDRIGEALDQLGADGARIAFTAHSIPVSMADGCDYVEQLMDVSEVIAG